jgi:hypothetical protein
LPPVTSACAGVPEVAQTARLVAGLEGDVILAGDIAYLQGSAANFRDCFNPFWGQFRSRWHPVPGNHEYESAAPRPTLRTSRKPQDHRDAAITRSEPATG